MLGALCLILGVGATLLAIFGLPEPMDPRDRWQ